MGEVIGLVMLVLAAGVPFVLAMRIAFRPGALEEPPWKIDASGITIFPRCVHCGWKGELDATAYVEEAAAMRTSTIMKSPPCCSCGRRWEINLTTLAQRRRTGSL